MNVKEKHIHMILSIPPRLSISELMRMLKGKIMIKLFKSYSAFKRRLIGETTFGIVDIM